MHFDRILAKRLAINNGTNAEMKSSANADEKEICNNIYAPNLRINAPNV